MGGTPHRMETFARSIMKEIGYKIPTGTSLVDISQHSHRYLLRLLTNLPTYLKMLISSTNLVPYYVHVRYFDGKFDFCQSFTK